MELEKRVTEYKQILTQENLTSEHLLTAIDMITADLTSLDEKAKTVDTLSATVTELRDTNHKLFLKVTGTQEDGFNPNSEEVNAKEKFKEMIAKGEL